MKELTSTFCYVCFVCRPVQCCAPVAVLCWLLAPCWPSSLSSCPAEDVRGGSALWLVTCKCLQVGTNVHSRYSSFWHHQCWIKHLLHLFITQSLWSKHTQKKERSFSLISQKKRRFVNSTVAARQPESVAFVGVNFWSEGKDRFRACCKKTITLAEHRSLVLSYTQLIRLGLFSLVNNVHVLSALVL